MANSDTNTEGLVPGGAVAVHTATLTAQNTFTTPAILHGDNNLVISGTLAASTVVAQRSFDGGTTWIDVPGMSFTAAEQGIISEVEPNVYWRVGIKTGGYGGSDSVDIRISK
jgi:hypothetical protein